jgi:hypothetical protein
LGPGELDGIASRLHQAGESGTELNLLRYDQDAFHTLLQENFHGTLLPCCDKKAIVDLSIL